MKNSFLKLFIGISFLGLVGCPSCYNYDSLSEGHRNAIAILFMKDGFEIPIGDYGYSEVYVIEAGHTKMVDYNYYNELILPLYHDSDTTTFVLKGQGLSDTLRFTSYNPRMIYNKSGYNDCGWTFEIDEPKLDYSTIQELEKRMFDEYNSILRFYVKIP